MKNDCEEIRRKIAESIGCGLAQEQGEEVERHCAACEACRNYRERLLRDDAEMAELASCEAQSVRSVEQRAIDAISNVTPIRRRHARFPRAFSTTSRIAAIAATAAATIIILVGIDFIRGGHNGAVPAFADVQEKMKQFNTYSHRTRAWDMGEWKTCVFAQARGGFTRVDNEDSTVVLHNGGSERSVRLVLYHADKRAVITRTKGRRVSGDSVRVSPRGQNSAPFPLMANFWKNSNFVFARTEHLGGKNTAVYEMRVGPDKRLNSVVWVDLKTELPVRHANFSTATQERQYPPFYGLRLRDFLIGNSKPRGWIDLKEGEPRVIEDDFKWSTSIDTLFFSEVPPLGYRVEQYTYDRNYEGPNITQYIAHALSCWVQLAGNVFPDDLNNLTDSTKVKPLLLHKYRRGEDPVKEFRAAYGRAKGLLVNSLQLGFLEDRHPSWQYLGKGTAFGDPKKIIFWMKYGEEPYCIIYADLHVATSVAPPTPAKE